MSHAGQADAGSAALRVVLLGNDAIAAAAPATPVQLMHACRSAGFDVVVPPNWGDELVAMEALRQLDGLGRQPAVLVACPHVAARVEGLAVGPDMALVATVAPPVAAARHLRRLAAGTAMHLTYVGGCPDAAHGEIDARFLPDEFLVALAERGIVVAEQPELFEDVLPPDRRRWVSLPGGVPMPSAVARRGGHILVELDGIHAEVAARWRAAARGSGVVDAAAGLGCGCSGALPGRGGTSARARVAACDPPRSRSAVIVELPGINLQRRIATAAPAAAPVPSPVRPPPSRASVPIAAEAAPGPGSSAAAAAPQRAPEPAPTAVLEGPGAAPEPARPPEPPEPPRMPPPAAPEPEVAERHVAPPMLAAPTPVVHTPPRSMLAIGAEPAPGSLPTPASPGPPARTSATSWLSRPLSMRVQLPVMVATIVAIALVARLTRPAPATAGRVRGSEDGDVRIPAPAAPAVREPGPSAGTRRARPPAVPPAPRADAPAPPRTPAPTRQPTRTATPTPPRPRQAARVAPPVAAAVPAPVAVTPAPPPVVQETTATPAPPPVVRETTATPAPRPAVVDSAALEREAIRRELEARRRRLDSLARRVDSLYRPRPPRPR